MSSSVALMYVYSTRPMIKYTQEAPQQIKEEEKEKEKKPQKNFKGKQTNIFLHFFSFIWNKKLLETRR